MDAGINNVIYMELNSGPKIANSTCGKTIVAGTIDRGSTVQYKIIGDALHIYTNLCYSFKHLSMLMSSSTKLYPGGYKLSYDIQLKHGRKVNDTAHQHSCMLRT